jgi:hypothetical protein
MKMKTQQKIFEELSKLEAYFYYLMQNLGDLPHSSVEKIHANVNSALLEWHRITGCKHK